MGKQQLRAELIPDKLTLSGDHMSVFIRGGYTGPPSWNRYVLSHAEELQPFLQEIRKCLIREELVGDPSTKYAINYHFEFDNGDQIAFDKKGWAELQAACGANEPFPVLKVSLWIFVVLFMVILMYLLAIR